ncbi:MAG: peptide deformylase [Parcubacteria group bacterium CG1_02_40_82]|uniref:Peptide deformylase n=4 Tax=Candidatus Portnoyibacteriota TaxID=1817913 RepID=A0A2M7IHA6_9BACT|nr:MAG: peptide deformylase [Parcubacteria group bacterium CG1_02_40_82]PIQ75213.1 MAG: peptide deformylase [Candidatus Portnoybacteria bacterium CG11_big_fil_rev_8_21_14_0_20_40_15]PIS31282.1 MAG: peptide deformylase [Candidatus Portnoybacteria bacterium CG08_land_8_20_14_0_20_40_83]PIW75882.1 MAG: peptide deformylase [Candidatus Portnoybacteria bacterium CG_4_8_14_3_um_filter_40_10]PIY74422.1 MAG: peptide deformylase [Candidatus Portnoybacteria bacterium CG_4_10_14_0_8_um_filter_40_50]PJA646
MLEIKKYGEPILRKKTQLVGEVDDEIRKLVSFLVQAMYQNKGAGLAANQIGLDLNMAVIDTGNGVKVLINPKIISSSGEITDEEGCLSLPGIFFKIKRPENIEVEALDKFGKIQKIKAQRLEARAICHEVDHLNGKLIIDRIGFWQRLRYKLGL